MQDAEELLQALQALVVELKKGINSYAAFLEKPLQPQIRQEVEQLIKQMHQTAVKINVGIEGIKELTVIQHQLHAFAQKYQQNNSQHQYNNKWE